jgi:hypothetical protein
MQLLFFNREKLKKCPKNYTHRVHNYTEIDPETGVETDYYDKSVCMERCPEHYRKKRKRAECIKAKHRKGAIKAKPKPKPAAT